MNGSPTENPNNDLTLKILAKERDLLSAILDVAGVFIVVWDRKGLCF
ncbi:MAG: hypothetical protein V3V96_02125 [Acidiferrobacterales bacterium]